MNGGRQSKGGSDEGEVSVHKPRVGWTASEDLTPRLATDSCPPSYMLLCSARHRI